MTDKQKVALALACTGVSVYAGRKFVKKFKEVREVMRIQQNVNDILRWIVQEGIELDKQQFVAELYEKMAFVQLRVRFLEG